MELSTKEFKVSQVSLLSQLMIMRLRHHPLMRVLMIAVLVLLLTLIIFGIVYDVRLCIIALMITFIVIPMITALLYINDALDPGIFYNSRPHSVSTDGTHITIRYTYTEHTDDTESSEEDKRIIINRELQFLCSDANPYYITTSGLAIPLGSNGSKGLIMIPDSAFTESNDLKNFISAIYDNTGRE